MTPYTYIHTYDDSVHIHTYKHIHTNQFGATSGMTSCLQLKLKCWSCSCRYWCCPGVGGVLLRVMVQLIVSSLIYQMFNTFIYKGFRMKGFMAVCVWVGMHCKQCTLSTQKEISFKQLNKAKSQAGPIILYPKPPMYIFGGSVYNNIKILKRLKQMYI